MPANGGAPRARNLGASMAGGQYLVFLDGDDVLMPHMQKGIPGRFASPPQETPVDLYTVLP